MVGDYTYEYRPVTRWMLADLLDKIEGDIREIENIEARYARVGLSPEGDQDYQRLVNQADDRLSLSDDYEQRLGIGEEEEDREVKSPIMLNGVVMAVKSRDPDFIEWAREQIELADMWDWD